jgi:hypothetical protein
MKSQDPTREELLEAIQGQFPDADAFDAEEAIYWFAADWHGGQWSNLYSVLSTSGFRPGRASSGPESETVASDIYSFLEYEFCGIEEDN